MPKTLTIQRIPLSHIDFSNHDNSLLPFPDDADADLISSIKKNGILHPPIVQDQKDGAVIVSGRKRLNVAQKHLKLKACECLIVSPKYTKEETITLALEESLLASPLSCIQKAIFLQKVTLFRDEKEAAKLYLPLWGQSPQVYYVNQYLKLTTLEDPISRNIHNGLIGEKTAILLSNLSFRDRFAIFEIITGLRLSMSNQRKIVNLCCDLAKRFDTSLHAIVTTREVSLMLQNSSDNPQQTAAQLMSHLNKQHSPDLSASKKQFNELRNKLKLPKWACIEHSPAFEQDSVTLKLTLDSQQELENCWQEICKIKK